MKWILSTELTIEETNTGFIIYLLYGSWSEPSSIKYDAPEDMNAHTRAKYLRLGLEFASELMAVSSDPIGRLKKAN